ncbi:hypothetical protein MYK68_12030 [Gordonia sp. PP30]|uniref:hypothetical protein n=1 Tax=unclassified Gordonia (in: high G+C Gram-positive bacteria) TaxID=2657482 RepID=UPI001FFE5AC3|nr:MULTISPECIES: hypothetical protein [unclassified Gordonia (in: high G+C Gram-positive bacteria)]UQE73485.1 hypothetical protein MYK68_12030 [Gordonia sp. PP30]
MIDDASAHDTVFGSMPTATVDSSSQVPARYTYSETEQVYRAASHASREVENA